MKLYRMLVRTSKATGKKFHRHVVPVPERAIKTLGWTPETALAWELRGDELVIRRK